MAWKHKIQSLIAAPAPQATLWKTSSRDHRELLTTAALNSWTGSCSTIAWSRYKSISDRPTLHHYIPSTATKCVTLQHRRLHRHRWRGRGSLVTGKSQTISRSSIHPRRAVSIYKSKSISKHCNNSLRCRTCRIWCPTEAQKTDIITNEITIFQSNFNE